MLILLIRVGGYRNTDGDFYNYGQIGHWWCTGHDGDARTVYWQLNYDNPVLWRNWIENTYEFSVCCVRNLTGTLFLNELKVVK